MSAFLLSQILIGVAFVFDLASFQFKARRYTLVCFTVAASLISTHYFLLGQHTAGFVIAVSATRFAVSVFSTDRRLKYLFLGLITITGIWTFDEWFDVLPLAAGYIGTFAAFQSDEKLLRQLMMCATLCVISLNIIVFSPAAILLELFFLYSNVFSYWRFYLRAQTTEQTTP